MKSLIVNERENVRVPFLRGILTRELLDAGMSFDEAYDLATEVRRELAATAEISSDDLRDLVAKMLADAGFDTVLELYKNPVSRPPRIMVYNSSEIGSAFSRSTLVRSLQSSGMRTSTAEEITGHIYDQLLANSVQSILSSELGYLTYLCIREEVGKKAAKRYLVWIEFERGDKPLLLLIGGAVGTGKSSIATQIAHRMEIVRTQSTDMLREVMRMMIPKRVAPVLHCSSFEAWKTIPPQDQKNQDEEELVEEGFRNQAEMLLVPCEAVLQRAERESVSIILEGVHALPRLLDSFSKDSNAICVHVTLAVLRSSKLRARLRGRSTQEPKRRARRYLKNFDSIWTLQSFLLSEADQYDASIITNSDMEKAIRQVISTVNDELGKHFNGSPLDVFGDVVRKYKRNRNGNDWQELVPLVTEA